MALLGGGCGESDAEDTDREGSDVEGTEATETGTDTDSDSAAEVPANLLLIILDDFGLDMATFDAANPCYEVGDPTFDPDMPNIAGLCQDGVRFTQAWATPLCSPTRASILTGYHMPVHGITTAAGRNDSLPDGIGTLPLRLHAADSGYATANIGKWHLSTEPADPNTFGWDHYAGSLSGALPSYNDWQRTVDGVTETSTVYASTQNVDDALSWLATVEDDEPWLLWFAVNVPHTPIHLPPPELHDRDLVPYTDEQDPRPYGAAMMEALDTELGRLFDSLRDSGEWDDTIVVVMGDNGTARQLGDQPPYPAARRKGSLYQGGIHVPMIVAGRGIDGGRTVDTLVSTVDLHPTLLEWAGVPIDEDWDLAGTSLASCLLDGSTCEGSQTVFSAVSSGDVNNNDGVVARDATHKLICFEAGGAVLFDMVDDPRERTDLYDPASPDAIRLEAEIRAVFGDLSPCTDLSL